MKSLNAKIALMALGFATVPQSNQHRATTLLAISAVPANVCFWGQSGHQWAANRCLLLTQSGHLSDVGSCVAFSIYVH
jgi:hypothetical protein